MISIITAKEAAGMLKMSPASFRRDIIQRRVIPHIRLSPRRIRVRAEDVEKLVKERTIKGVQA